MPLIETLHKIQKDLRAPKGQENKFGGYKYRSCEDILEAVKKLLPEGVTVLVSDDIVMVGERYYVKATASITDGEHQIETNAFARESLDKKGMDAAQITGATSSYARKYALNGLFCIDDTKDADSNESKTEEESRELSDAEDCRLRDFNYLLSTCADPVDVDAVVDEYGQFIGDLPKRFADQLAEEIKKARGRGKTIPHVYHFASAAKAREFYEGMKERIPKATDTKVLAYYITRWDGKLRALDRQLGKKDEVSGMTPYNYIMHLYNQKTQPLAAE